MRSIRSRLARGVSPEAAAYGLMGFGTALDHSTTQIGLAMMRVVELNPLTREMIVLFPTWPVFDVLVLLAVCVTCDVLLRRGSVNRVILLFPLIVGFLRTLAGIHTLLLIVR